MMNYLVRRAVTVAVSAVAAAVLVVTTAFSAWAAESMTLTFVRHGESEGNASGFIDTSTPGPDLTALGEEQAADVALALAAGQDPNNPYDSIYYSTMVRTKETAEPTETALGLPGVQLPGIQEIQAGIFEGQSQNDGIGRIGYAFIPLAWVLGLRFVPLPGSTDPNGNEFEARMNDSIDTIYYTDDKRNAIVFSHGAAIMFWTMMNVDNPDPLLILTHPLGNTAVVVVTGNPEDGWTLQSWDGVAVDPDPSLPVKLFVDVRDVVTPPQTATYNVVQAVKSGQPKEVVGAIKDGVVDVGTATLKFPVAVTRDIVDSVRDLIPGTSQQSMLTDAKSAVRNVVTANGATDLTDGNKAEPGKALKAAEHKARKTIQDVNDRVEHSVEKAGATVKKIADKVNDSHKDAA